MGTGTAAQTTNSESRCRNRLSDHVFPERLQERHVHVADRQAGELIIQAPSAGVYSFVYTDSDISAGQPGIAAYGTPAGNSITGAQLGPLDSTCPEASINSRCVVPVIFQSIGVK